ncbi:MAG: zf-TFIIB domain-containing protein [Sedimentisphaerales bacterium]|nr:zf-TFIIB domain-containing protein [Sedimentisphaerales bacterium]
MDCPACGEAMVTLELADVEIDHCVGCGGIWLDAGELELLMDDRRKATDLLASFRDDPSSTEASRRCPICDKKMGKIVVGQATPALRIDKCRRNHGLWFDRGELADILDRAQLDKESRIQRLLADMFGRGQEDPQ